MSKRKTRPGVGRAFLKCIIGLLVVFILCAGAYLFVLEYNRMPASAPQPTALPEPTKLMEPDATSESSPAPTEEAAQATTQPSPAAAPEDAASQQIAGMSVPAASEDVTAGMIDFKLTDDSLTLTAYLSAADISSDSAQYYIVATLMNGDASYVYDTWSVENSTGLDADLSCFSGSFSAEDLPDGWYALSLMAVDGEISRCGVIPDGDNFSFIANGGKFIRYAE